MNLDLDRYEWDFDNSLDIETAREAFLIYLTETDASERGIYPDHSYLVYTDGGEETVLETVKSDENTIYNVTAVDVLEEEVEEERNVEPWEWVSSVSDHWKFSS